MRHWDPDHTYQNGHITDFEIWSMELSYRQHTLGSSILFCKRPIEKITELTVEELIELQCAFRTIEEVYAAIPFLNPDRWNYLQMGNALHTLHFHAIPRYEKPRSFQGQQWLDVSYGMPVTWKTKKQTEETIRTLKQQLNFPEAYRTGK